MGEGADAEGLAGWSGRTEDQLADPDDEAIAGYGHDAQKGKQENQKEHEQSGFFRFADWDGIGGMRHCVHPVFRPLCQEV